MKLVKCFFLLGILTLSDTGNLISDINIGMHVFTADISPDRTRLAIVSDDRTIHIIDLTRDELPNGRTS